MKVEFIPKYLIPDAAKEYLFGGYLQSLDWRAYVELDNVVYRVRVDVIEHYLNTGIVDPFVKSSERTFLAKVWSRCAPEYHKSAFDLSEAYSNIRH